MGLELVELAMEVEDEFGITIEARDGVQILTCGALYDYVILKLRTARQAMGECALRREYFRIRDGLIAAYGPNYQRIRPSARLERFVAVPTPRMAWRSLGEAVGVDVGRLVPTKLRKHFSTFLTYVALIIIVVLASVPYRGVENGPLKLGIIVGSAGMAMGAVILREKILARLGTELPAACQTVGDLARLSAARGFEKPTVPAAAWSRDQVWQRLQQIVARQFGIQVTEVSRSTHFVNDLGAG